MSEVGGQRSEVGGRRSEVGGRRSEVREPITLNFKIFVRFVVKKQGWRIKNGNV